MLSDMSEKASLKRYCSIICKSAKKRVHLGALFDNYSGTKKGSFYRFKTVSGSSYVESHLIYPCWHMAWWKNFKHAAKSCCKHIKNFVQRNPSVVSIIAEKSSFHNVIRREAQVQAVTTIFLPFNLWIIFSNTINPTRTIVNKPRLKSSGRRSNPFDGASLVKKTSGPPKDNIRDWDSTLAEEEVIDLTEDTSYTWDGVRRGVMGSNGA